MKRVFYPSLAVLVAFGFAASLYLIFYVAPMVGIAGLDPANQLFFNQKIFYWHVPSAFVLFVAVLVCGYASLMVLLRRGPRWDDVAASAGELAVLFGAVMLATGSIWAKPAWGKWWVWDLRLTTALILWLTMVGYILVRKYGGPDGQRIAAGLALFGCVNVPLVYFSIKLADERTNHPETSVVPGLDGLQRLTFWISVLVFLLFFLMAIRARIDLARAERRVAEAREAGLDSGLLE